MNNYFLKVNNLNKSFKKDNEEIEVLKNINLNVNKGEFISIVGTSGCGKSTLLNIIAALDKPTSGDINYSFNVKEDIGYMMQDSALLPWFNIEKNAHLASKIKKINSTSYINTLLNKYGLNNFKNSYPNVLSGGMKQRVSLIRTIGTYPKLLLLDEPFSKLDYQSRLLISLDVYKLVKENNITTILITHDIAEAISLSDKVIVLSKRPATIKKIYDIKIDKSLSPTKRRKDKKFMEYFDLIGKDLDLFE